MNIDDALADLGATEDLLTHQNKTELDEKGLRYCLESSAPTGSTSSGRDLRSYARRKARAPESRWNRRRVLAGLRTS